MISDVKPIIYFFFFYTSYLSETTRTPPSSFTHMLERSTSTTSLKLFHESHPKCDTDDINMPPEQINQFLESENKKITSTQATGNHRFALKNPSVTEWELDLNGQAGLFLIQLQLPDDSDIRFPVSNGESSPDLGDLVMGILP